MTDLSVDFIQGFGLGWSLLVGACALAIIEDVLFRVRVHDGLVLVFFILVSDLRGLLVYDCTVSGLVPHVVAHCNLVDQLVGRLSRFDHRFDRRRFVQGRILGALPAQRLNKGLELSTGRFISLCFLVTLQFAKVNGPLKIWALRAHLVQRGVRRVGHKLVALGLVRWVQRLQKELLVRVCAEGRYRVDLSVDWLGTRRHGVVLLAVI